MAQAVMMNQQPSDIADSYRQQALLSRPEMKKLTKLDQEMAATLGRTDLTTNQKMKHFQDVLNRFRNVRNDILQNGSVLAPPPAIPAPPPTPPPAGAEEEAFDTPDYQGLINSLVALKSGKKRARKTLTGLKKHL